MWLNNEIIYQVFLDRFDGFTVLQNSTDFLGGNFRGVINRLDYLAHLGISTLWLSPFYKGESYHGYHITGFDEVDPHFGTEEDLLELIRTAKSKGFKIIADFVPNHCSDKHPFFQDAIHNTQSHYKNWFIFKKWPDDYLCFLDYKELPKLNLENPETSGYMLSVAEYWLSKGLDGFRIDHAIGPSHAFWQKFREQIKKTYPAALLIGEVWVKGITSKNIDTTGLNNKLIRKITGISQSKAQLEYYHELDGVLDFRLYDLLINAAKNGSEFLSDQTLKRKIRNHLNATPPDYYTIAFLDNHDTDRFLKYCNGNIQLLLNAFELLFQLSIPVVIYNGTENCRYNQTSVDSGLPNADLAVREPINWNEINAEFVEEFRKLTIKYRQKPG